MGRPVKLDDEIIQAVDHMAKHGVSLKTAFNELEIMKTSEEIILIERRKGFQQLLWESRHRYYNELATDPNFKKDTAVGKLLSLAQKLEESGEYDKAAEVYFKIGKVMGWVGPESTVSVFGELSQKDLDAIREKVAQGTKPRVN